MALCPKCGNEVAMDVKFCPKCSQMMPISNGQYQKQSAAPVQAPQEQSLPKAGYDKHPFLTIWAFFGLFTVVLFIVSMLLYIVTNKNLYEVIGIYDAILMFVFVVSFPLIMRTPAYKARQQEKADKLAARKNR